MFIKQISVFLENRQGRLEEFATLLGDNGVDLVALSIADTTNFGILRAIVNDTDKACEVLQQNGFTATLTDVLAVAVQDSPGGLAKALHILDANDIFIEYLYSLVRRIDHMAVIIFRTSDAERAAKLLSGGGVRLLGQGEVAPKK